MNYEKEFFTWGIISATLTLMLLFAFILLLIFTNLACQCRHLNNKYILQSILSPLLKFRCISSTTVIECLQTVYNDGHPNKLDILFCTAMYPRTSPVLLQEKN